MDGLLRIGVVGAGPRGTSIIERLVANAAECSLPRSVEVHVVDPWPPGPGRVWRTDQSGLLWLNSTAADNTMYPDETVTCAGPTATGPPFLEWARDEGVRNLGETPLGLEASRVHPGWFPSRRLYSEYLAWVLERALDNAPPGLTFVFHRHRAVDCAEVEGRYRLLLEGVAEPLEVDAVILAQGHHDPDPAPEEADLAAFAAAHGLAYLPTAYSADADLQVFAPGEAVIVRGLGLAFIDCMVLLFEGRGGQFRRHDDGVLHYEPSGREPILYPGSRRGVPYHAKTGYVLSGSRPPVPRFYTAALLGDGSNPRRGLDFDRDLWPLMAKDLAYAWYFELFHAHPERVVGTWEDFDGAFSANAFDSAATASLVERSVPSLEDRLDLRRLDRPLASLEGAGGPDRLIADYVDADLARRADPDHSSDLALITALLGAFGVTALLTNAGAISARSMAADLDRWFFGFFSFLASGPPPPRLEQLNALARAGLVRFAGDDLRVVADATRGVFRAEGPHLPEGLEARGLLEARLPAATLSRNRDPLIKALVRRGVCSEDIRSDEPSETSDGFIYRTGRVRVDSTDRLINASGHPVERIFALGPWVAGSRATSGVARPRLNAAFFRQNDAVARRLLGLPPDTAESTAPPKTDSASAPA